MIDLLHRSCSALAGSWEQAALGFEFRAESSIVSSLSKLSFMHIASLTTSSPPSACPSCYWTQLWAESCWSWMRRGTISKGALIWGTSLSAGHLSAGGPGWSWPPFQQYLWDLTEVYRGLRCLGLKGWSSEINWWIFQILMDFVKHEKQSIYGDEYQK